ncbi:MAG TPA: kelch repeat-containing protein [Acidimicrobiales bacterium]|nr:kelch repeat-containing protein [Acidimicrobiales bacterium]
MRAPRPACLLLVLAAACNGGSTTDNTMAPSTTRTTTTTTTGTTTTSTTVAPPPPTWQSRAAAPTARQEVASAVAGGRVWVMGGLTSAGATDAVEAYDPATDRWAPGPGLPVALHHASATTYRGEIVVMGGFLAAGSLYARPSDRVLALRDGGWVDLPRLRRPRGAAAAAAVGDVLVLAGGRDVAALVGPTEVFDGSGWRDADAIPTRRDHLSAASDGRSLFTVGGRFLQPGALSAALERFDAATGTWERLPAMPTARGGQGAALAGGRLVVAGGEDPSGVYGEVEAYDVAGQQWTALPALPTPRHGLAVERVGDQVLVLVGGTAFGVAPSAVAESLSPLS